LEWRRSSPACSVCSSASEGIIITPLLVLGFGIDMRYAMGAALCSVIATSCGAAAAYLRDGISNMRIGLFLSVATTIGAVCRALMATVLDQSVLSIIFGVTLLATVGLSLTKKQESPLLPKDSDPLALRLDLPDQVPSASGATAADGIAVASAPAEFTSPSPETLTRLRAIIHEAFGRGGAPT
jgi:uncharacterized protein